MHFQCIKITQTEVQGMDGQRLAELRKDKNLNQEECAALLGISKNSLSKYENNINDPDDKLKLKIAELFNVSLDYLMGAASVNRPLHPTGMLVLVCDNLPQGAKDELMALLKDLKKKYHLDDKMFEEK